MKGTVPFSRRTSPAGSVRILVLAGLVLVAILGVALVLALTRNGAGTNGDSVHYLNGAQNLLAGNGFSRSRGDGTFVPINTFPPVFSILIAGLSLLGPGPFEAARYLNALLFGANVFLIGWILLRQTKSVILSGLGALLAVTAINLVKIHSWVMSEGLYIFFSLLVFLAFQGYAERRSKGLIVLAGGLTSLAILTRYVGFSLLATGCLALLFLDGGKFKDRLLNTILFGAATSILVAIWFIRNSLESDTLVNKVLKVRQVSPDLIGASLKETVSWVAPNQLNVPYLPAAILLCLGILFSIYLYMRFAPPVVNPLDGKKQRIGFFERVLTLYLLVYYAVLVLNTLILDASTDVGGVQRYLIPVYVIWLIWILILYSRVGEAGPRGRQILGAVTVLGVFLFGFYAYRTLSYVRNPGTTFGYTDNRRNWTGLVSALEAISPDRPLIASDYELVFFLAGRPPYSVPNYYDNVTQEYNSDYKQKMDETRELLRKGAVLVAVGNPQNYDRPVNGLAANLEVWKEFSEARLYVDPKFINQP